MQCSLYSVVYTLQCSVHCTVQYTLYSVVYYTVQCSVQYCTVQCTILYSAVYYTVQCSVLYRTVQCTTLYSAVYYAVQCSVLYCSVQCTILYRLPQVCKPRWRLKPPQQNHKTTKYTIQVMYNKTPQKYKLYDPWDVQQNSLCCPGQNDDMAPGECGLSLFVKSSSSKVHKASHSQPHIDKVS